MSNQTTSKTQLAREFALFLNTRPSKAEISAWIKATKFHKEATLVLRGSLTGMALIGLGLWWACAKFGVPAVGMYLPPTFMFCVIMGMLALGGLAAASLSGWTDPLSDDKSDCARFVKIASNRPDLVLAVDRELYGVDLEYALQILRKEESVALEGMCATANSLVKTSS